LSQGENYIGPTQIFGLGDPDYQRGMQDIVNEIRRKKVKRFKRLNVME
jgi:hypothetical protein